MKKNLIIGGVTLGVIGGATAYFMMNKKARNKAMHLMNMKMNEAQDFFEDRMEG